MTFMSMPDLETRYRVRPGRFRLADHDPADTAGLDRKRSRRLRAVDGERLRSLQARLYAEQRRSLLVVLQGLDASGKDGTIAHVMRGVNPLGVQARAFKRPSSPELAHDWLWRCVLALPERGHIGIFNRSHYEEVTAVRVHEEYLAAEQVGPERGRDERFWEARCKTIVAWERHLAACGTRVVKFFLHISREEQLRRFRARLADPRKRWKFDPADLVKRSHWDDYMAAYRDLLGRTSTEWAPWRVVPADHKWVRNLLVTEVMVETLRALDLRWPDLDPQVAQLTIE
jgi:PPK2 family polyphosphate:nucleotide phosphotransferase